MKTLLNNCSAGTPILMTVCNIMDAIALSFLKIQEALYTLFQSDFSELEYRSYITCDRSIGN